jgi:hypothetical protein
LPMQTRSNMEIVVAQYSGMEATHNHQGILFFSPSLGMYRVTGAMSFL